MDRKNVEGARKGPRRSRERKHLEPLSSVLKIYTSGGGGTQQRMAELFRLKQLWYGLMGDRVALISSPYRLKDGVLYVAVHDPMWIAELPYIKEDMISKLADSGLEISDIKFTLSKVYKKSPPPEKKRNPLSNDSKLWAERLSEMIEDDNVRAAYLRALKASLRRGE